MSCSSTQKNRFQLRRANEGEWESLNPTLLPGEPAVSMDTKQIKIGTGVAWRDTDYINLAGGIGAVGTPTTLATLIVLTATTKSGFDITLETATTLPVNQAVAFRGSITADAGGANLVANRPYYVFASISGTNSLRVKTSLSATTPL
jgi:hypothetical protein